MKPSKTNTKSKRNRYRPAANQLKKCLSLKASDSKATSDVIKPDVEIKIKSGNWKRRTNQRNSDNYGSLLETDKAEPASCSSSAFRPGTSYSDVLFNGEKRNPLAKVRSRTSHQVDSRVSKSHSKRLGTSSDNSNQADPLKIPQEKDIATNNPLPMKNLKDLSDCTAQLMKGLNIELPSWNFTDFGTFSDVPKFVCQFNDYNYLACEKVAFVGLKLATDGKFKL